jgi:cytochrome o ubiquinol oxidase operon protein cyoD
MSKVVVSEHEPARGTFKSYTVGFGLSLALTLIAYMLPVAGGVNGWTLIGVLSGLAVCQLLVQLIFFLHLGRESKPYWNISVLVFAAGVVVVIVFGSLWIMRNIEYNHNHARRSPQETNKFLIKDEGY